MRTRARLLGEARHAVGARTAAALGSLLITGAAVLLIQALMAGRSWWWVGLAAGAGTFIHSLRDAMTRSGSPLWWPLRIRVCR
ncbi:metal-dependent hydrolase [Micromonospora wenchangensis]|uniref:metal-dependent hydrolase n=1 Tax=Micromonospora wenchangensis TaxID=1185415 RepID=UPI0011830C82|nr:metal-dependent hydrolase [Micromonospora wenchangensis]